MKSGKLSGFIGEWCDDFFGGGKVRDFEDAWATQFGSKNAVAVNSNTSGLIAALGAAGLSPGDEVIVPPYTVSTTVVTSLIYGCIPKFVDIEPDTFCLDPVKVQRAISRKTKAINVSNSAKKQF